MAEAAAPVLRYGEPLAFVSAFANRNPTFGVGSIGGRFVLLCAIGDLSHPDALTALQAIPGDRRDETEKLIAVFCAEADALNQRALAYLASRRLVFADPAAAAACGLIDPAEPAGRWILLDPNLRTAAFFPLAQARAAIEALEQAPHVDDYAGVPLSAPALIVPNVFEPAFCKTLIEFYAARGGEASGITVQDAAGRTSIKLDESFKRRSDAQIDDEALRGAIRARISRRLAPEITKAFMWKPTRIERYIVACYDAASGGYFKPHRDNTTPGTAHRKFAVTINLNAGDYDGGDLRFPEFGTRTYRAPTGGAVVFSCGLLHEATPVTRGTRYACLPFLYDDESAELRRQNNVFLDDSIQAY
jgi:predicted 2-oxoglutarate/Fe(II)-dependent dioxygenase YbiX